MMKRTALSQLFSQKDGTVLSLLFLLGILFLPNCLLAQSGGASSSVTKLLLIDAKTDEVIRELSVEDRINLGEFSGSGINIQAITEPDIVDKVVFSVNRTKRFREESGAPYAIAGNAGSNFHKWRVKPGEYKIAVTPFKGAAKGKPFHLSLDVEQVSVSSTSSAPKNEVRSEPEVKAALKRELADKQEESSEKTATTEESSSEIATTSVSAKNENGKDLALQIASESTQISGQPELAAKLPTTGTGDTDHVDEKSQLAPQRVAELPQEMNAHDSEEAKGSLRSVDTQREDAEVLAKEASSDNLTEEMIDSGVPVGKTFSFSLSDTEVTPPTRSASFGTCSALIDKENKEAIFGCTHSVMNAKSAYASFIREGAGSEGEEVTWCGFDSAQTPIAAECPLSSEVTQALSDGRLFVTITSQKHPHGEIRGMVKAKS